MPSRRPQRETGVDEDARGAGSDPTPRHPARPTSDPDGDVPRRDGDGLNTAPARADELPVVAADGGSAPGPGAEEFASVLDAARAARPDAYRTLYDGYGGRICAYLRWRGAPDPDDLTNEVFSRAFRNLDGFSGGERDFCAWVFTIARRLLIDEQRRLRRRPVTVELLEPDGDAIAGGDVETEALTRVDDARLGKLLDTLTVDQREVIALRIIADLPIDRVASVLGKEPATVKALQHRGIAALRRRLETARA
jgi:RNA polymerase sigma-70 factor (ECF subfamily)